MRVCMMCVYELKLENTTSKVPITFEPQADAWMHGQSDIAIP